MNKVGLWALGLIGSVAAHVGLLALLIFTVQPDPISDQPLPTSELEVQAYQLDRVDAQEQQPQSEQTDANTPDGQTLESGAIPRSEARLARPETDVLRPDATPPPTATEIVKPALTVAQTAPDTSAIHQLEPDISPTPLVDTPKQSLPQSSPTATRLVTKTQSAPRLEPTKVTPTSLVASVTPAISAIAAVVRTQAALPVAQPAVAIVPILPPQGPVVMSARPEIIAVQSQKTDAPLVLPSTPNARKLKAGLAFSGGEGDVDPVSIAAFQSLMQPGDINASGDQLRDGVAGLLAQVPCSRLQVSFDPDTAILQVKGHIPEDDLRAPVLAALQAQMGANITVSDNILILPRPQCGALSGIAGVGLPQSTDQITNPLVIGNDTHAKVFSFSDGDLLSLDMIAPDYDAFIYLDYFDADGMVLHLEPNEYTPLRQANAQEAQQIGARTMQDVGLKLIISPPYGQEIAVAFAASEPLYDGLRPIQEPAAAYLEWLQEQVANARANNADFKGEWVYFFVSTTAR